MDRASWLAKYMEFVYCTRPMCDWRYMVYIKLFAGEGAVRFLDAGGLLLGMRE